MLAELVIHRIKYLKVIEDLNNIDMNIHNTSLLPFQYKHVNYKENIEYQIF